ncbi:protein regulator of cytokinesis 1 isoform X2 [Acyrthosiphon pisum]|uniref:Protein regulator of cytokinesis 1 n=1 Tax=Acyrthosiphon pisum TaxID=7029 RepID=A0A8R2D295_ACYPI|nr:protein regulator of cytokinesis 1 isoform X2 [Acyrthosiphon pisum]|eukprot:XP_016656383.1 PREDICTED: protein regulator of cytokinesis 1 isoform X2 [Acyrthosiphon pisum]
MCASTGRKCRDARFVSQRLFTSKTLRSSFLHKMDYSMGPGTDKIRLILDEICAYSEKELQKVQRNLDVIYGTDSDEKKNGINQLHEHFKAHITSFLDEVVMESDRDKNNIIKDIEELLVEKELLEKELQMHISIDDHNDATPLIDVQINIDKSLQECRKIKEQRMLELNRLQEEEKQICQLLNEKPKYSGIKDMPSATMLENIKSHLIDLTNTQIKRRSTFAEQKSKVESLLADLGEIPILQFDKMVLGDPNQFQLSKSNLDELQKLIKRLENQTENQKCMAMELRTKLNSLWDRLQIDVSYREHFVSTKKGFGKSVIQELKLEVERCETLKKENIKQFIEKLRSELNDLWDRCHFGERQRKQCPVYYSTEYNEDVMDLLDIEVDNAKKFYNDNISIYHLFEEREHLWNKMIMMQEQANDPARLWQNRGGQLLKEEKERKIIQKELPKVERELKNQLLSYEQRENKIFYYRDERLFDFIERQWDELKSNKKILQQTKSKIQSGTKPQTPLTATRSKRKIVGTSSNQASKVTPRRQLFNFHNTNVATLVPLNSTKLNEVNITTTRQHPTFHGSNDENGSVESYATFQEHLESKKHRLFTSPTTKSVLREPNATFTTPRKPLMKTPVKGSQIPIPTTPKTPLRTTPRMTPNTRTVTKLTRTINNKLPIIF